jgi:hypothetical protein
MDKLLDMTELQFLEHDLEKLWKRPLNNLTHDEFNLLVRAVLILVQDKIKDFLIKENSQLLK